VKSGAKPLTLDEFLSAAEAKFANMRTPAETGQKTEDEKKKEEKEASPFIYIEPTSNMEASY